MSYNDCLQDVPDIFENEIGESLASRTEGLGMLRELGPPDLCHIVKVHSSNRNEADIGSYHHVLGVDTSSSASVAAYINSLQYSLNDRPGWFGGSDSWKIASGTYCSFNAFSKVDVRVQIKIPGGVDAYAITVQGERKEVTDEMWRECQVSAILRAILYADPAGYSVTGLRRLTLVSSPADETRVVEALVDKFWSGWRLGSSPETQVASHARNYLVDGLIAYFTGQRRFGSLAGEVLAPLAYAPLGGQQQQQGNNSRVSADFKGIDPEVAALLAEAYMRGDEEVQAVRVMHQALKAKPSSYPMLYTQAEFLRRKHQYPAARKIAMMAVKYAPSEFHAWARLTQIYIEDGDMHNALLTLNTCPMYTFVDRDYPRVPTPRRINYPVKSDVLAEYNMGDSFTNGNYGPMPSGPRNSNDSNAPGAAEESAQNESSFILRLSAPTLKGTFAEAYKLLANVVSVVGWDELLRLRSLVFVMEEEYRNSAIPSVAVDDQDDDDDNDDDNLPLYSLSERKAAESEKQPAAVTTSEASPVEKNEVETLAAETPAADSAQGDDDKPAESEEKPPVEPKDEPAGTAEEGSVKATEEGSVKATEEGSVKATEEGSVEEEKPVEATEEGPTEAEDSPANLPEPAPPAAAASQPKGKKKRGKKGKKSKDGLKAPDSASKSNSVAEPVANGETEPEAESDAAPDATSNGHAEPNPEAKPEAKDTSIAALGEKMEDVSLSDTDGGSKDRQDQDKSDDQQEPTAELAAPQTAAREAKEHNDEAPAKLSEDAKAPAAAVNEKPQEEDAATRASSSSSSSSDRPAQVRKRLCERWLDNLIMILFDDLRTYTNWRTKMHSMRATGQPVTFQFTQAEWEALGDLALRLHRPSEAREAFESALRIRFSAKAWLRLLELYTGTYTELQKEELARHENVEPFAPLNSTDSLMMALDAAVWLAVYNDRWYNNSAYPNPLANHIMRLIGIHGLSKVRNSLVSMNLKPKVFAMLRMHLDIAEQFKVTGVSW